MKSASMKDSLQLLFKSKRMGKRFATEEYKLKGNPKYIYSYVHNSNMTAEELPDWMAEQLAKSPTLSLLVSMKTGSTDDLLVQAISTKAKCALIFAKEVLKGRFPEGEEAIIKSEYKKDYLTYLKSLSDEH